MSKTRTVVYIIFRRYKCILTLVIGNIRNLIYVGNITVQPWELEPGVLPCHVKANDDGCME